MSPRLSLVVIRVADLAAAERFYAALGLQFVREKHGSGPEHLAAELPGEAVFEIYPAGITGPTLEVRLGFQVESVDAAVSAIVELGGTVASPPQDSPWGRRAVVVDPNGNRVELTQSKSAVAG